MHHGHQMVYKWHWDFTVMRYFCTYFDINYLDRGIALYRSLEEHVPEFTLFVLCMDNHVEKTLSTLDRKNVTLVSLAELETNDPALLVAKSTRSRIEYYFTCTPALLLYILNNFPGVDLITYLDADLFFFSNPEPLLVEIGSGSVAIIGHRFPEHFRHLEWAGVYNVGWLSFRRDSNALECLCWWRERCLEWCYDRVEDGKYADQKYLDRWPDLFKGVTVLEHKGANVAAWNLARYSIRATLNGIYLDDQELIFFHFHGFKRVTYRLYDPNFYRYGKKLIQLPGVKTHIVAPYVQALRVSRISTNDLDISIPVNRGGIRDNRPKLKRMAHFLLDAFRRKFIIC